MQHQGKPHVATSLLPRWLVWTLAICSGLILPLAFAPTEWWFVAVASLSILYALLQRVTPRHAFWIGWLFGLGYFGMGVHWVYFSLHLFGAAIAPIAALITLVFVLVMTLFPALTTWLWARYKLPEKPVFNACLFAALWVLAELIRGKLMGGFPWILIGYSQTSGPMGSLAPYVGVYGLSFLVVLVSCVAVVLLLASVRQKLYAAVVLMVPLVAVLATKNIKVSTPVGEPITVRMVQANIPQEMKFSRQRLQSALTQYTSMSQQPGLEDVNLVVWPETAIPTFFNRVDVTLQPFVSVMDNLHIDIISGGFDYDGENTYNAVKQLGGEKAVYRKRHLVPFGEFMPFRFVLDFAARFIDIPMSDLSADTSPLVPMRLHGIPVGISICFEDVFGEEMRAVLPESQLLVNVSNDAWFGNSAAPHQHEQKARMRAREFSRPLIRVTNTGVSSAIDHEGRILGRIAHNTQGILDVQVQPRSGYTVYARTGNWPVFLVCLMFLFMLLIARRKIRE